MNARAGLLAGCALSRAATTRTGQLLLVAGRQHELPDRTLRLVGTLAAEHPNMLVDRLRQVAHRRALTVEVLEAPGERRRERTAQSAVALPAVLVRAVAVRVRCPSVLVRTRPDKRPVADLRPRRR